MKQQTADTREKTAFDKHDIKSSTEGKDLDQLEMDQKMFRTGLSKSIFYSLIAVICFFVPITIDGQVDVVFGYIYNFFLAVSGPFSLWGVALLITVHSLLSTYAHVGSFKNKSLQSYYQHDTAVHTFFYLLGAFYVNIYVLHVGLSGFTAPEWIVGEGTGGTVIPSIVLTVAWIIPIAAILMPLLLNYGALDFVGSLLEPIMRPLFKVPGKSAIDAIASFISSSSVAILITSNLYKMNIYTKREAVAIATSFSAVSVGFAILVINTAEMGSDFIQIYFTALLIAFIISFFMIRIPPLSRQTDRYYDGSMQSEEERSNEAKFELAVLPRGISRAAKRAYSADSLLHEMKVSLKGALAVLPKVLAMLASIGITGLIVAEYTPVFNWLGLPFIPLLELLNVPNAALIAPSIPVGIAEMFLPVLLIAGELSILEPGAIYFVTTLSLVQIIFFSESIVVINATRLPIKLWELVVCFFQRTLIAIPVIAFFMHLMY